MAICLLLHANVSFAWNDETHLAVAKAAGYPKWFNAAGPDMIKVKAGKIEGANHYVNNERKALVTPAVVAAQIDRYNTPDREGHLYGAVIHAVRDYIEMRKRGKYGEYHLAFCAHYIGDLTMPLHNIKVSDYTKKTHKKMEAMVNDEGIEGLVAGIRMYPVEIDSEDAMKREVARVASLSIALGYRLEDENRLITKPEAYEQLSHAASLFKGVLTYVASIPESKRGR